MSRSAARKALALRSAPPRSPELVRRGDLLWIEAQYLQPDPDQPRKEFDPESLTELAESLSDVGVLTPLRVRPPDALGVHTITDGERRWRAGHESGIAVFPCLVEAAEPDLAFLEAYLANLHRDALTPVDAAVGLQHIRETFHLTADEEVAGRLKKSVGWVRQMNAVLGLDPDTRRVMQERGEPVAIAVGLRPQSLHERLVTLDAVAELPSRDAKVHFISRVNDQRRAGLAIEEAVQVVSEADAPEMNGKRLRRRVGATRTGRPGREMAPFTWREDGDSRRLDVAPAALETTRLAAHRVATVEDCVQAMRADLLALRESLDGSEASGELWDDVVAALGPLLDRPFKTTR